MYTCISLILFCLAIVYIFSRTYPLLKATQLQPFMIILNIIFSLFLYSFSATSTGIIFAVPYFTMSALFGFSIYYLISIAILFLVVFPSLSNITILITCFTGGLLYHRYFTPLRKNYPGIPINLLITATLYTLLPCLFNISIFESITFSICLFVYTISMLASLRQPHGLGQVQICLQKVRPGV